MVCRRFRRSKAVRIVRRRMVKKVVRRRPVKKIVKRRVVNKRYVRRVARRINFFKKQLKTASKQQKKVFRRKILK